MFLKGVWYNGEQSKQLMTADGGGGGRGRGGGGGLYRWRGLLQCAVFLQVLSNVFHVLDPELCDSLPGNLVVMTKHSIVQEIHCPA